MSSPISALKTEQLSKTFVKGHWNNSETALRGVTIDVRQGEVFGLLGPNGAGKTTLFKIVLGLVRASSGHAWIYDRLCSDWEGRRRVGFVPENPYLYDHLTAPECLSFFGRLCGLPGEVLTRRIPKLLDMVGLSKAQRPNLRGFSKGMLQRVAIAQAMISDPDLLLFDESMSGLDPIGRMELRGLILELKNSGKTIVMTSHSLHDVELLCDRVVVLNNGKVVALADLSTSGRDVAKESGFSLEAIYREAVQHSPEQ